VCPKFIISFLNEKISAKYKNKNQKPKRKAALYAAVLNQNKKKKTW
jgi:hypothetical protein